VAYETASPQLVLIVESVVAEHELMKALTDQLLNTVFNKALVTVVDKTVREFP
jgi:hypothetical protein